MAFARVLPPLGGCVLTSSFMSHTGLREPQDRDHGLFPATSPGSWNMGGQSGERLAISSLLINFPIGTTTFALQMSLLAISPLLTY